MLANRRREDGGIDENRMPNEFRLKILNRIGKNLKYLQRRDGLTMYEIEQRTGIGHTTLWSWENGYSIPPIDKILWMVSKLGWKMSEILGVSKDGA